MLLLLRFRIGLIPFSFNVGRGKVKVLGRENDYYRAELFNDLPKGSVPERIRPITNFGILASRGLSNFFFSFTILAGAGKYNNESVYRS